MSWLAIDSEAWSAREQETEEGVMLEEVGRRIDEVGTILEKIVSKLQKSRTHSPGKTAMNTVSEALDIAVRYHQAGNLQQAEQLYHQILQVEPQHVNALHLLGVIAHHVGRSDRAVDYISQAVRLAPNFAEAYNNLGIALAALGKLEAAVASYQQALRLKPDYAEALNNLGNALLGKGEPDDAVAILQRAVRLMPQHAATHNNLGVALREQGNLPEAVVSFQQALRLKPDFAQAHYNLGVTLTKQGKLAEAVASFQQALRREPAYAEAHNNLGVALKEQGRLTEAVASWQEALRLKPDYADAHNNLGVALKQGDLAKAVVSFQQALRLKPDFAQAHNNLGIALKEQGKLTEAVASWHEALRLKPDYAAAHNNLGTAFTEQGELEAALASYQRAVCLKPDYAEAHLNVGTAWLLMGDFERGWPEYEWRGKCEDSDLPNFPQPLWDGSSLEGRTILLYAEQGLGDTLQFIRFAPLVKERGGNVLVACPQSLVRLLTRCSGIDRLIVESSSAPFDVHAPLLSIPGILGTTLATIPASVPYLYADPERTEHWRGELGKFPTFKIGIAWQGNPLNKNDRKRSFPLTLFAPLAGIEGVQLFSLQKGAGTEQLDAAASRFPVTDLGSKLDDFLETAAVVQNLDLIITADTALGHLAGALGARVWVTLSFAADWRWFRNRDDSPWYPTMRLFRQPQRGNWEEVFARIAEELTKWRANSSPTRTSRSA